MVGIYLRLSSEDKDKINKDDYSESIKNQRNMLVYYISKHDNFYLVDEYCDEDLSGAGTYRPEFERLIKDCEEHRLDIVLCKSQSRFSRDMEIVEKYINNKFIEWNIRFIGLADNADTDNFGNKKARQINGLVNEWYLEDISNNIRSAFNSKMKQGEFISPFAPLGYEISSNDNNKIVIDKIGSEIVKNIYNLYLKGLGFTKIAEYLNDNNVPSPSLYKYQKGCKLNIISNKRRDEIKWNGSAVKKILTNEIYIGNLVQGKRTTVSYKNHRIINKRKNEWIRKENTHEGIIDKDTFYKVQSIINSRRRPSKKLGTMHIFSGKVFCMECNNIMKKKSSQRHEYLVCSNSNCLNKSIRYDMLEGIILKEVNGLVSKYYDSELLKKYSLEERNIIDKINTLNMQQNDLRNRISRLDNYLKSLYEDKVNGIIAEEYFIKLTNSYNNDKKIIEDNIKSIEDKISYYRNYFNDNIVDRYKSFDNLNKVIVDEFIDKVYVGKIVGNKRKIEIKWRFLFN